ncbi:HAD family hydrolase [Streptomyces sp. NPDC057743]|uniref:HAD family hydrolase n=1 Tax=Streptomyces sp. NPDC057743 TaxID=3346236 RepID=UPI00369D1ABB
MTVDDVTNHKPHPEPFLTAAQLLGTTPDRCLAFEDAPAGLEAARAAGMATVALTTTHQRDELSHMADAVIPELSAVTARLTDAGIEVAIAV